MVLIKYGKNIIFLGIIMEIEKATYEDLEEILDLQKLAYLTEAKLLNDYSIKPLTQTLIEFQNEFKNYVTGIVLKLMDNNIIIGSVRAHEENGRVYIGRLIVHPEYRNKGYGTKILNTIETFFPNKTFELFTSSKSENNLNLYKKNGYKEFKREKTQNDLEMVFLEKNHE